jgi:hypothetical protein
VALLIAEFLYGERISECHAGLAILELQPMKVTLLATVAISSTKATSTLEKSS